MTFLVKIVVNALALWAATVFVPGVSTTDGSTSDRVITLLLVGAVFGVVNTVVKPVVKLLALPFYILSLGLIAFVVNALMLQLTAWIAGKVGLSFTIDDFFWSALGAAVVVTVVSMILNLFVPESD